MYGFLVKCNGDTSCHNENDLSTIFCAFSLRRKVSGSRSSTRKAGLYLKIIDVKKFLKFSKNFEKYSLKMKHQFRSYLNRIPFLFSVANEFYRKNRNK